MTAPFAAQPEPQQPALGAEFQIDPNNPQVGVLRFGYGPAVFQIGLPTASVVGFLRSLADETERRIAATPGIVRPVPGLFLPNGNGLKPPTNLPRNGG